MNVYGETHYAPHRALADPPYTTFPVSGYADALGLVADPLGQKGTVIKGTVPRVANRLNGLHVRSELSYESERQGTRRCYAGSFLIRSADWIDDSRFQLLVTQIHDNPDASPADAAGDPPLYICVRASRIEVWCNGSTAATNATQGERNANLRQVADVPFLVNAWNSLVIDFWASWWKPRATVWINGARVCDETSNVGFNDTEAAGAQYAGGLWIKHGPYVFLPADVDRDAIVYHTGLVQAAFPWGGAELIRRELVP